MRTLQWLLGVWLTLGMVGAVQGQIRIEISEVSNATHSVKWDGGSRYRARPKADNSIVLNVQVYLPSDAAYVAAKLTKLDLKWSDGTNAASIPLDELYTTQLSKDLEVKGLVKDRTDTLQAELTLSVPQKDAEAKIVPMTSNVLTITLDRQPPKLGQPDVSRVAGDSIRISIPVDDDVDPTTLKRVNFVIASGIDPDTRRQLLDEPRYVATSSTIELMIQGQGAGQYVIGYHDLKDSLGNVLLAINAATVVAKQQVADKVSFLLPAGPEPARSGLRVPYPEYVGPKGATSDYFSPHEKVDSRVIRLYYFRDANRVVQIINRDVQQLNLSRVNYEAGLAVDAKDKADEATAQRRYDEQQAIQVVQKARAARREIEKQEAIIARNRAAKAKLTERKNSLDAALPENATSAVLPPLPGETQERIDALNYENAQNNKRITILTTANTQPTSETARAANQSEIERLEARNAENLKEISRLSSTANFEKAQEQALIKAEQETVAEQITIVNDTIKSAQDAIRAAEAELSDAQIQESQDTLKVLSSQEREDRARAKQFRQEVIAGTTDRDTYAAGDINSIDPVQQVSLSVIGEGVIQLRGPSKGINKIARLIHQIDTPVGQVKVGIQTVQINGEHGDRMEYVYERIDKHIAQARFLTNESMQLFRRAVQEVASEVAQQIDEGFIPPDMDEWSADCARLTGANLHHWRYVNAFFGGDFIRELREMDSELLKHDNKLLSLHSMDTISLAGALYVTAVAKHSVRMMILDRFLGFVQSELPRKEVDYYRALTRIRHADPCVNHILMEHFGQKHDLKDARRIWEKALRTYQFSNFVGFFDMQLAGDDTLNNVQHATIRMAQALKAQLVAELEFKNLVLEKSLLERKDGELAERAKEIVQLKMEAVKLQARNQEVFEQAAQNVRNGARQGLRTMSSGRGQGTVCLLPNYQGRVVEYLKKTLTPTRIEAIADEMVKYYAAMDLSLLDPDSFADHSLDQFLERVGLPTVMHESTVFGLQQKLNNNMSAMIESRRVVDQNQSVETEIFLLSDKDPKVITEELKVFRSRLVNLATDVPDLKLAADQVYSGGQKLKQIRERMIQLERDLESAQERVLAGRVLDEAIDETELKAVELLEATRAHVANVDNYLKRLAVALEDDVMAQFYNPAMMDVRRASRYWDVTLSQVENTTVLTNNRSFAKVSPTATMELDLPSREILLTEAVRGGKALATEYGNLLKDPTFLAAASISAGRPPLGLNSRQSFLQGIQDPIDGSYGNPRPEFGAALEGLIPDPAVYKFETGTGYEIRPVIQPDGHSIVYTFDYMYTTNVREPVRADEKHLGRVKRHFVHTDVQTSSYEMREVSRYNVALKASRTARGVPLLEDVPGVGLLFRPLPNQESSLQQNIIYGTSTIYPTLFDLMGLRWSPYAEDLHSQKLALSKPREREISQRYRNVLLRKARNAVREDIGADFELPAEIPSDYREPEVEPELTPNAPRVPSRRSAYGIEQPNIMEGRKPRNSDAPRTAMQERIAPPSPIRPGASRGGMRQNPPVERMETTGESGEEPRRPNPRLEIPDNAGAARSRRSNVQLASAEEESDVIPQRLRPRGGPSSTSRTSPAAAGRGTARVNSPASDSGDPAAKPKSGLWNSLFKK
ncbi:MAG: hypothetical protein ACK5EA_09815 [Planctomycetaceae bacterium]